MSKTPSKLSSGIVFLQRVSDSKLGQARQLRMNMTPAESELWQRSRRKQLRGLKFRRQQVIEGYIVDFFCHELKLVIEVDGGVHLTKKQKETDEHRRNIFEARGLKEIRFSNQDILENLAGVLKKIQEYSKD